MYKIIEQTSKKSGQTIRWITREGMPNTFIPFDPANTDYQQYLAWLAEGNTPLSADAATILDELKALAV